MKEKTLPCLNRRHQGIQLFGKPDKKPTIDLFIIALAAMVVSGLTLYSSFGLDTLLPVFTFFFPVEVAATASVHGA